MNNDRSNILNRLFVVFGLVLLVPCAIGVQLFRINFVEGPELRNLWSEQAIDYISIPAQRGNIYDENGSLLATNSVAYKVAVDPKIQELTQNTMRQVCDTLAKFSSKTAGHYLQKIKRAPDRSRYVVLDNNVSAEAYRGLQQLDNRGVLTKEQYERRYNFGSLAAHTLGFVNHQMKGMTGLEKIYNGQLNGEDGVQQVRRDRSGNIYSYIGAPRKQPKQGKSLHTTIDSHIQAIVQEELKAGIDRTKSSYGSAIVMDPRTGAIKAMANYPTFNPNNPASLNGKNRRNFAISDMIEPGSTFKLVTAIAAVEQQKVQFDETFDTPDDGTIKIHGQWMRDHTPLGTLTFPEVIEKSSNIATSKIAMRLSKDTFYQYARNLGFGTPTNIDLPNEEAGRLTKPYEWSKVSLPWKSIGYEVQVTPIQLAQAYAAFANGGKMMRPYVVKKIMDGKGETVWEQQNVKVRQIAESSTIKQLYPVFRDVVSDSGTAKYAQVNGLPIAGKTGTAQKFIEGEYRNKYRSSFVGFFPAQNPKYVCLILLDSPDIYPPYGGVTAGPIFRETAKRIAGLDNEIEKQIIKHETANENWASAPDVEQLSKKEAVTLLDQLHITYKTAGSGRWVASQTPKPGAELSSGDEVTLNLSHTSATDTTEIPEGYALIPNVGGMSMRKATTLINQRGFETKMVGSGTIYRQAPRAGDLMKQGRTITVHGKAKAMQSLISENTK
ncbi:cell division protein FtsI (penicillin-binding protein 3) [Fodinibius salinus]|uniref:Cell division protein FtsI (Penicillin-binding protein 3) n=1 Tax=Fodinibius salinus TaxID=860790 RepID=A0A5D3YIZ2_9BACT|nr:penicillin-binding protein 2 [Fodinibius salinus]TYP92210.1 cell division protein FtsI (penicillin-binding protein 3) [Fodinibius salinus]